MFGSNDDQAYSGGILDMLLRQQGIDPQQQQQQPQGLLDAAASSPFGSLDQQQAPQPAMMRAPMPSSLSQSPDMPAMGAGNAGPQPMPPDIPMPPPRPPGIGSPMQLQGSQPPTPMDQQPPQTPQFTGGAQQPPQPGQQQPQPEQGFGDRLAKAFGGLSNIYGAGLPGDKLIELGAAIAHPRGMAVGLQELADRNQRGGALKGAQQLQMAKLQREQAGQVETAKYISKERGIPFEQAFGLVTSGQAGPLVSATVKTPQLVNVRQPDGSMAQQWQTPGQTDGVNVGAPTPAEKYSDVTDQAARDAAGVPSDYKGAVQRGADGKLYMPGKAGVDVNIAQKGETEFAKEAAKGQAKFYNDIIDTGATARTNLSAINSLRDLGGQITTGGGAALQGWLANNGIKVGPNVPAVEAYGALIDKLTPQQRVPGSGATSDFDAKMFKNSLPGLIRTPEGNKILLDTMEGLERDKMARADIAADVLSETKSRSEGLRALQALPDPAAAFKAWQQKQGQAQGSVEQTSQPTAQGATAPAVASPTRQPQGAPVRVQSLDQLRGLPKGTEFIGPDNKRRYVP